MMSLSLLVLAMYRLYHLTSTVSTSSTLWLCDQPLTSEPSEEHSLQCGTSQLAALNLPSAASPGPVVASPSIRLQEQQHLHVPHPLTQ